jgi:hypothetical protein
MTNTRNLSPLQLKKLAHRQPIGACYVVLERDRFVCLTHGHAALNSKRCSDRGQIVLPLDLNETESKGTNHE